MAEEDSGQERTEQPTPKRQEDARKKGQIARSRELNTMAVMLVSAMAMVMLGKEMIADLGELMKRHMQPSRADIFDVSAMLRLLNEATLDALWLLAPVLVLLVVVALLAPLSIGGWAFSLEAMQPRLNKLDPIKGIRRLFSAKSLVELLKAMAKFALVTAVAIGVIWLQMDEFIQLGSESLEPGLGHAGELLTTAFLYVSAALVLIAAVDVPFQIWDHNKQMRMTRQEIRDEMKDTEGKPEVRSRIRQLQREMAQRRMMEAVPKADVVVTNPTHFAVALKYDPKRMRAPTVLARGTDLVALNIRKIAEENNIARIEAPPLARALYHTTEIGQEIPQGLYLAVAQLLAYVFQLKAVQKNGGKKPAPPPMDVPDEFKRYTETEAVT
ncbi:MAG: flagellar biosynthesis protein FlhB [Pseudomonadota bacterium]|nr:flagellar biosynthesis protein FlhB [Pseudomonadota bacterium]